MKIFCTMHISLFCLLLLGNTSSTFAGYTSMAIGPAAYVAAHGASVATKPHRWAAPAIGAAPTIVFAGLITQSILKMKGALKRLNLHAIKDEAKRTKIYLKLFQFSLQFTLFSARGTNGLPGLLTNCAGSLAMHFLMRGLKHWMLAGL
ncbi:MAG: hypothetical protein QG604_76 [Candidatus Dependentiae bacterium]|nr:hypothetical protein [Candidatus Dependentiae bacterium]